MVLRIRKVRKQISDAVELLKDKAENKEIVDNGKKTVTKLQKWEEEIVQNKAQSNDDIINFINRISADYIFVKGEMDVNIPYVTNGQKQQYEKLNTDWQKLKADITAILSKDVAEFNTLCKQKNIDKVIIPDK